MRDAFALLIVAAIFGVLRFIVPVEGAIAKEDVFKDLAHIFVGFAFGYAAYAKDRWELWAIPSVLTIAEVVAFMTRKAA